MKWPDRRYLTWMMGLAVTAALPLLAGFTTLGWEISEILGLAGTLACLALCGAPVRPRESSPPVLLSLGRHETLGWIALAAAVLHVLVAVAADHTVIDYLKPTSPLYQLAGIAALVLLLLLTITSLSNLRRRLWRSHRNFQATHIVIGCALLALLAAHVIATNRYSGGYARRTLFFAAAAGGIAMLLRRRRSTAASHESAIASRFAFGRHSTLIVSSIVMTLLALSTLIVGRAGVALREPLLPRAERLTLDFDHGKHAAVNCLTCHHNFADGLGSDACVHCHRSTRTDLKIGVEARFHSFCLQCHRDPEPPLKGHGPVSGCVTCHVPGATVK